MDDLKKNKELTAITLEVMMDFFANHDMEAMALVRGELKTGSKFLAINSDNNKIEQSMMLFTEYIAREMEEAEDSVEAITIWSAMFKSLYLLVEGMSETERAVADKTIQAIMKGEV